MTKGRKLGDGVGVGSACVSLVRGSRNVFFSSFVCVTCRPCDKELKANAETLPTCMSVGEAIMAAGARRPVDSHYFLVATVSQTCHYNAKHRM